MAKRFTDTEKWRDEWWAPLSNDYRIIWQYLVDSCTIAGIWKKDFRGLNFNCNTSISEKELLDVFGSRLIDRGNYFFIPKFIRFQYPKGLNSNKPAIVSVVKELTSNNLLQTVNKLFGNDYLIIKDKDKDKDKDKVKDKEQDKDNYITVENERIYNPFEVLDLFQIALNGRQKEQGFRNWRDVVPEWFESNVQMDFSDNKHVLNAFSKYYMSKGKPKGLNGHAPVKKFTINEL